MRWDDLIERVPHDRAITGAEVGVWRGHMSRKLLEGLPSLKLYLVDRWKTADPSDSFYTQGTSEFSHKPQRAFTEAYRKTLEQIEPFKNRVTIIPLPSVVAADQIPDRHLDFAFIDADHSFLGCLADIRAWYPKVRPGGFIGGHDFDKPSVGDVTGAVKAFFMGTDRIEISSDSCWWFRK